MSQDAPTLVTRMLDTAEETGAVPAEQLLPLVYEELRRLARARMAKLPPGNTLQPTALVHEAYLRLVKSPTLGWKGRGHFFGAAARSMWQILVEQARHKRTAKRGADAPHVALDTAAMSFGITKARRCRPRR